MALEDLILDYLEKFGPTGDRKLADVLGTSNQHVNQVAHGLEAEGRVRRIRGDSGRIENHLAGIKPRRLAPGPKGAADRVIKLFREGPTTDAQIAGRLGIPPQQAHQITDRLAERGIADKGSANGSAAVTQRREPAGASRPRPPESGPSQAGEVAAERAGPNTALSVLHHLGFRHVGRWIQEDSRLRCELTTERDARKILYAFVTGETVLYLGKTTKPLKTRMHQYQNPGPSQLTNISCNQFLQDLIRSGSQVQIHVLLDDVGLMYRGHSTSLAAGMEDTLIARVNPPWNRQGR